MDCCCHQVDLHVPSNQTLSQESVVFLLEYGEGNKRYRTLTWPDAPMSWNMRWKPPPWVSCCSLLAAACSCRRDTRCDKAALPLVQLEVGPTTSLQHSKPTLLGLLHASKRYTIFKGGGSENRQNFIIMLLLGNPNLEVLLGLSSRFSF